MDLFYFCLLASLIFGKHIASCLLDDASYNDVTSVKLRLSEEKSKRLLIQNDVESLMLRMEKMERMITAPTEVCAVGRPNMTSTGIPIYFNAKLTKHTTLDSRHVIVFDKVLDDAGKGYSPATGIFRADVPGLYQFSLSILSHTKNQYAHIQLMKNSAEIGRVFAGDIVAAYGQMGSVTAVTRLAEGDEVYARELPPNTGYLYGDDYCSFSGVLLSSQD